jgi:hypothetical protein
VSDGDCTKVAAGSLKWPQVFNLRVVRVALRSGLPTPVAGRSLRAPPSAHSVLTRFGIPPALISKRRLVGTGSPSLAVACFA